MKTWDYDFDDKIFFLSDGVKALQKEYGSNMKALVVNVLDGYDEFLGTICFENENFTSSDFTEEDYKEYYRLITLDKLTYGSIEGVVNAVATLEWGKDKIKTWIKEQEEQKEKQRQKEIMRKQKSYKNLLEVYPLLQPFISYKIYIDLFERDEKLFAGQIENTVIGYYDETRKVLHYDFPQNLRTNNYFITGFYDSKKEKEFFKETPVEMVDFENKEIVLKIKNHEELDRFFQFTKHCICCNYELSDFN